MTVTIFSDTKCKLGEGPLWHPERQQLFWFDILAKRLITRLGDTEHYWQFDEHVSAAGWIDHDRLLIASETRLFSFNLVTQVQQTVVALEAKDLRTRSNDGRADPWGGFWIGTMGKQAEAGLGVIYRYYQGMLRPLYRAISISNAICFSPNRKYAYFADTATQTILRQ
ncbi:MAG: SMP-30/gluconolactonase/LRE family protein, partial [Marinovum sp.]|nr:SMP-30/gluconolactonase/LRE family protein [Marinovum sp.]